MYNLNSAISNRKVFVVNKSFHDFSSAEKYGELIYLSDGKLPRTKPNQIAREFLPTLAESQPEDYILLTSLSSACSIACAIFVALHNCLNLLIYEPRSGLYITSNLTFVDIKAEKQEQEKEKPGEAL